jgi:hypothetical protein
MKQIYMRLLQEVGKWMHNGKAFISVSPQVLEITQRILVTFGIVSLH